MLLALLIQMKRINNAIERVNNEHCEVSACTLIDVNIVSIYLNSVKSVASVSFFFFGVTPTF